MIKRAVFNTLKTAFPLIAAFAITLSGSFAPGPSPVHAGQLAVPEKSEPPVAPPGHRVIDLTPGSGGATGKVEPAVVEPLENKGESGNKTGKKSRRIIVEVHEDN